MKERLLWGLFLLALLIFGGLFEFGLGFAFAQTQSQIPPGMMQFSDGNGAPYAGGSVTFYAPGTTTPKATYSDPNGASANPTTITLDPNGRAIVWGQGEYREILKDLYGNTVWDQVVLAPVVSGASPPSVLPVIPNGTVLGNFTGTAAEAQASQNPDTYRNRLYNADMRIDQWHNTGATQITAVNNSYIIDRWKYGATQASKFSAGRDYPLIGSNPSLPVGFVWSMGFTVLSGYAPVASDVFGVSQPVEGWNGIDFGFGTSASVSVGLSFWVWSSVTGTFGGSLCNYAGTRCYAFSYNVPLANVWTYVSMVIPGDSGGEWTIAGNNLGYLYLIFGLGAGANREIPANVWTTTTLSPYQPTGTTNLVVTGGAKWYLTGVQLEPTQATPFEHRPFATELAIVQRYFECSYNWGVNPGTVTQAGASIAYYNNGSAANYAGLAGVQFKTVKRANPTITMYSTATGTAGKVRDAQNSVDLTPTITDSGANAFSWYATELTPAAGVNMQGQWCANAEL